MSDTRVLLNRIADFRKRLEAMPRLVPGPVPEMPPAKTAPAQEPVAETVDGGSRTQAILEYSLRQLAGTAEVTPPALSHRARRLLIDAQGLVSRLKAIVNDPLLAGPAGATGAADPLAVHFRETAAMTEAAVRYVLTFPDSVTEQQPVRGT